MRNSYNAVDLPLINSSGYALEYTVPRLCQKYTCSGEWAWLYDSGYPLKCIAPLFPIGTRNLHSRRIQINILTYLHSYAATITILHIQIVSNKTYRVTQITATDLHDKNSSKKNSKQSRLLNNLFPVIRRLTDRKDYCSLVQDF